MLATLDPAWAWQPYQPTAAEPWDQARAAHLYRRAGFGASPEELAAALEAGPQATIARLTGAGDDAARQAREAELELLAKNVAAGGDPQSLSAAWLYRMIHTRDAGLEKLTLFWHGHFATSGAKVTAARLLARQNADLRRLARGPFGDLVQALARDPAMLIYLDSVTNRKTHPNENFAREVMELFCLGPGNYTEQDIQELARCLTGWELREEEFYENKYQHDRGEKRLLGQTGKFDGTQGVEIVVAQPATAAFIVQKLFRYYVCDELAPPAALLEPLVRELRATRLAVGPLVARMIGSNLFFAPAVRGQKVRAPVELAVNLARALALDVNAQQLARAVGELGQQPFFPPNVKGWDGGRTWINSATLLGRVNLVHQMLHRPEARFGGGSLADYAARHGARSPEQIIDWLAELLLATPLPADARGALVALAGQSGDRSAAIADAIAALAAQPEFQLA